MDPGIKFLAKRLYLFGGKTLKIWEARVAEENGAQKAEPGQVVSVSREGFTVACGQGALQILSLQLEGKNGF